MKISGFTFAKNAAKLYYPVKQAIESILPICDEFVVALGDNDTDDNTLQEIQSINSDKIKIINTIWDLTTYKNGTENAHQTDIAKQACTGDWLIYLQADEIIHEKYLPTIVENCEKYLDKKEIDGFLLYYRHFWGDFNHHIISHGWCNPEIRIIRNDPTIHSFISALSFRRFINFDGISYRDRKTSLKLNVIPINAYVYHYGWVRPPELMVKKTIALDTVHKGKEEAERINQKHKFFDYGNLSKLHIFNETHPKVMSEWIEKFNWSDKLHYDNKVKLERPKFKHEKFKYRLFTFIEQKILGGRSLSSRNWIKLSLKKLK